MKLKNIRLEERAIEDLAIDVADAVDAVKVADEVAGKALDDLMRARNRLAHLRKVLDAALDRAVGK